MKIHRILRCTVVALILAASLAGCSQNEIYGTMDTGVGLHHYSSQ